MKTLVLISRAHSETAFKIIEEIHRKGEKVAILFTGRGTHYIDHPETLRMLSFADLYTFKSEFDSPKEEVRAIEYDEFVKLLEGSERTFSWI